MNNKENVKIYTLGGIEEIGRNCTVYEYNKNLIIIDKGLAMFNLNNIKPYNTSYTDIEKFFKLFDYIETISLIITHCHDDHIGGLRLFTKNNISNDLKQRKITIYVSHEFNKEIIKSKHGEIFYDILVKDYNNEFFIDKEKKISARFYKVDHTIPHSSSILIKLGEGENNHDKLILYHSGDWRISENMINKTLDQILSPEFRTNSDSMTTFLKLRDKCDILVSESTNINIKNDKYCNEETVKNELYKVISEKIKQNKIIVITCFSSHVERIKNIIDIALTLGVKIGYMGKSLNMFIKVANKIGIINDKEMNNIQGFTNIKTLLDNKNENIKIIIVTGCQNEDYSVLNRAVTGKLLNHKHFVIMSSKPIPTLINRLQDLWQKIGRLNNVGLLTTQTNPLIHSSGHAKLEEIQLMIKLMKPKVIIPVHGTFLGTAKHVDIISKFNIHAVQPRYGYYIILEKDKNTGKVKTRKIPLSLQFIGELRSIGHSVIYDQNHPIFQERSDLINGGAVIVNVKEKQVHYYGVRLCRETILKIINCCNENENISKYLLKVKIAQIISYFIGALLVI